MFRNTLVRARPRPTNLRNPPTRRYATNPTSTATPQSRIERFNRRLPKFLRRYTVALTNAPISHITAFLLLHELTAIIPLFGLAGYFHYTHWLPSWFAEGAFVLSGVERFGRYFRRKGWIRSGEAEEAEREVQEIVAEKDRIRHEDNSVAQEERKLRKVDKAWNVGEGGVRLVVEFATAYAITKALIVPRVVFSVWATPGFARWTVVPAIAKFKRVFGRKEKGGKGVSAGTGVVEGGVVPKSGGGKTT
jgi:hypothetical protein